MVPVPLTPFSAPMFMDMVIMERGSPPSTPAAPSPVAVTGPNFMDMVTALDSNFSVLDFAARTRLSASWYLPSPTPPHELRASASASPPCHLDECCPHADPQRRFARPMTRPVDRAVGPVLRGRRIERVSSASGDGIRTGSRGQQSAQRAEPHYGIRTLVDQSVQRTIPSGGWYAWPT